jgi:hypothetical protein
MPPFLQMGVFDSPVVRDVIEVARQVNPSKWLGGLK